MKKLLFIGITVLALSACSSNGDLKGNWKIDKENGGCAYNEFTFMEDGNFSATGRNGTNEGGKYEIAENGKYKLDFGAAAMFYEIKRNGDTLEIKKDGRDNTCTYNKK
ncbi:hypothetical protein [Bacillus paramycoides]|uniref:hypothetical protein n=1 Tax=Bacillus paramycoides TaxID=2026194 RepID=UPI002E1A1E1A|nr:hypothetical protein [Bacillus paramycoides]